MLYVVTTNLKEIEVCDMIFLENYFIERYKKEILEISLSGNIFYKNEKELLKELETTLLTHDIIKNDYYIVMMNSLLFNKIRLMVKEKIINDVKVLTILENYNILEISIDEIEKIPVNLFPSYKEILMKLLFSDEYFIDNSLNIENGITIPNINKNIKKTLDK